MKTASTERSYSAVLMKLHQAGGVVQTIYQAMARRHNELFGVYLNENTRDSQVQDSSIQDVARGLLTITCFQMWYVSEVSWSYPLSTASESSFR